ncbi:BNR-4 repeat-containing protein [Nonomuraea sp. CA-143628]|uniref:BNR-4 repeat-containing protein n=1 Tax=Nonomuraea sp. CA-143628 TaxID=3239997 RepID=UPI003D8A0DEB
MDRRDLLKAGGVLAGSALLAGGLPGPASAAREVSFRVMTAATGVAARTDRRPVAGGVHDPKAGTTFVSWGGTNEDSYVQAFRHGRWSAPLKIIDGRGDSHNYPTMVQADDGHLVVVVGMHNGETVVARSPQPHTIDGEWSARVVAEGAAASYPMPFKAANGHLFVFLRETTRTVDPSAPTDNRPMLFMRSTDHGVTWQSSKQLTGLPYVLGSTDRADNLNEIYVGQLRYQRWPERVHLVWTLAGGGPAQHRHDYFHKDIHYAWFDPSALTFHAADGTDLGPQLTNDEMEGPCKVAVTPLERPADVVSPDYIQLVGWLRIGRPFVVWFTRDAALGFHDFASVWTPRGWQTSEVATGLRTREMEQIGPDTWRVYTTVDGQPGIATHRLDHGRRWTPETVIPTPKPVQRIELITRFRDPARILATGASSAREVTVADGDVYVAGPA